jgi:hypothetical protein
MTSRDAILLALLRSGRSDELVASALQVSPATVYEMRRSAGIRRRGGGHCRSLAMTARQAMAANDMLWDGVPRAAICVRLGISARTLARYVRPELRGTVAPRYSASSRRKAAEHMRRINHLGTEVTAHMWAGRRAR